MSGCIYCFTIVCCHGRHEKEGWKHRHEELKKGSKRDRIVAEVYDMIIYIIMESVCVCACVRVCVCASVCN